MSLVAVYVKATSGKYYNTESLEGPNFSIILDDNRPEVLYWNCHQINDDVDIFAYLLERYKLHLAPVNKYARLLFKKDRKAFWKLYRRKDNHKRSMEVSVMAPVPDEFVPKEVSPDDKPMMECVIIGGR